MSTISTTTSTGIRLSGTYSNPISVTGTITVSTGFALYGPGGKNSWTIDNSGLISTTDTTSAGIQLGSNLTNVQSGVVTNEANGTIVGGSYGVSISGPGTLSNLSQGYISAARNTYSFSSAVYIFDLPAGPTQSVVQVFNAGTLVGPTGVYARSAGSITNSTTGVIVGTSGGTSVAGIRLGSTYATVVNAGLVTSTSDGLLGYGGGSITNLSSGTITGATGVYFGSGFPGSGTFDNAGTVTGGTYAVDFAATGGAYRLIAEPGAVFQGAIQGGQNVLELASGASQGSLYGFGSTITNFSTLQVDSGADWRIAGNLGATTIDNQGTVAAGSNDTLNIGTPVSASSGSGIIEAGSSGTISIAAVAVDPSQTFSFADNTGVLELAQPSSFQAPIQNFAIGNRIDLTTITADAASWGANVLTVTDSGASVATLAMPGNYSAFVFGVLPDAGGTGSDVTVTATCYAAGTHVLTPRGEMPIERLHRDDLVMTISGRAQAIRWIGHRSVNFRRDPNRQRILPVRIAAHAFGAGRPTRNLLLSPDHAVYIDDVLIPIRHLINGTSVAQIERQTITYYHIELPQHDVLLADGMPAETYLDAGARHAFGDGDVVIQLHPEFNAPQDHYAMLWEQYGYAPLVVAGPILEKVRALLAQRAWLAASAA